MTKLPVSFMFSSVDSVNDLAKLLEDASESCHYHAEDLVDHSEAACIERTAASLREWIKVLRDFAARVNKVEC